MLEKTNDVAIQADNPFNACKLNREPLADMLTKLIKTITQPFVLSVSSPWGTGKTTFIRMWSRKLRNEGHPCIYYNAWKNDFTDNPFISFVSEINSFINDEFKKDSPVRSKFDLAKKKAGRFVQKASPLALKILSRGAIKGTDDLIDLFDFNPEDEKEVAEFLSKYLENAIDDYDAKKESITGFKKHLTSFTVSLFDKTNFKKPLFVFIDEIDRCRPTFSLDLLENIKHLFDIENIVFILAVDRKQLSSSVRTLYGKDMDTDGYLRRFIDLDYRLPEPSYRAYSGFLYEIFEMGKTPLMGDINIELILSTIAYYFELFGFSLRKQNQFASRLNCIIRYIADADFFQLLFLLAIRYHDEDLYNDILAGKADREAVQKLLNKELLKKREYIILNNYLPYLEATINVILMTDKEYEDYINELKGKLTTEKHPEREQELIKLAKRFVGPEQFRKINLPRLADSIELSGRFSTMV